MKRLLHKIDRWYTESVWLPYLKRKISRGEDVSVSRIKQQTIVLIIVGLACSLMVLFLVALHSATISASRQQGAGYLSSIGPSILPAMQRALRWELLIFPVVSLAVVAVLMFRIDEKRRVTILRRLNHCTHCGYPLTAPDQPICTECGKELQRPKPAQHQVTN